MTDSFQARTRLQVGDRSYDIYSLAALEGHDLSRLPFSLRILLENLLRFEDGVNITRDDIEALLSGTRRRCLRTRFPSRRHA
jgi:aconitate hydratase